MSILKVNTIQDKGGNAIISSDGSGTLTLNNDALKATPSFHAYSNTTTTTTTNVWTKVKMDTELYDSDSCFDTSAYRFTPTVAGKYYIYGAVRFGNSIDFDSCGMAIHKNGSRVVLQTGRTEHFNTYYVGTTIDFNGSTDYVEIYAWQNSGGTENFSGANDETFFGGYKLIGA